MSNKIKGASMIKMEIRKALPEDLTYTEKCRILEELAEEYRVKSRKEISEEVARFKRKNQPK